jgi:hypothetical protein
MCRHITIVVAVLMMVVGLRNTNAEDKSPPTDVCVDEIGKGVRLIGRLGAPLEQMITVEGSWSYPPGNPKEGSLIFSASSVDGKALEKPVQFYAGLVDVVQQGKKVTPNGGEKWTLRGFETGQYHYQGKTPAEYYRESGKPAPETMQAAVWMRPFTSNLVGVLRSRSGR